MQRASRKLCTVDGQRELPLNRRDPEPVSADTIEAKKNFLAAFNLAINVCGLDEKDIYLELDIDASHWSRMRKGESHFPLNKLDDLCNLIGNEIILQWWAQHRGYALVMLESETQRQLREAHEALARERDRSRILMEALHGKALA